MRYLKPAIGWLLLVAFLVLFVPVARWTPGGIAWLVVVCAWAMLPAFVAYRIAKRAGRDPRTAAMIGALLGWIGVLIVYGTNRRRTA